MLPVPDGSEVTGRFIEDWRALKPDTPCVVVLRGNQDFVFKLVTVTGDGVLRLRSLNPVYEPYEVHAEDGLEVWQVYSFRAEESRVGKECVRRWRSRW